VPSDEEVTVSERCTDKERIRKPTSESVLDEG
jgi:hypothetical protein